MRLLGALKAKVGTCMANAAVYSTLAAMPIVAQTPIATGQTNVQSAVDLLSLDLTVRDRHNRPVFDLKPEEMPVTDNSKPAKLTEMRLVNGERLNDYPSENGLRLHLGLGSHAQIDRAEVLWPDAKKEVIENLSADQYFVVREVQGIVSVSEPQQLTNLH